MYKDFLSEKSLLTGTLHYSGDEDGNIEIFQDGVSIKLTPKQQQDLVSLLEVNLDLVEARFTNLNK